VPGTTFLGVEAFRRIVRRYKRADPLTADVALAAAFIAAWLFEASIIDPKGGDRLPSMVFGSLALAALAWRRRDPLVAAAWFGVLGLAQDFLDSFFFGEPTVPFVAAIFMAYSTGRHTQRRLWLNALVLLVGIGAGISFAPAYVGPEDLLWVLILFLPPLLAGRAIRSRVMLRRELRAKAERLEADREREAQAAVADERARIATELQTVVANGVSAIVVQAEAVPLLLADGDTARARQAFEVIEETGRDALTEMRRLLGVLRRDGDRPELAPLPGLARLDALVEETRADGMKVDLMVLGQKRELAPGVDLTAYRAIQAALGAAAASGAGKATVILRYGGRDLDVEVRDDRAGEGAVEDPVAALRERFSLYGGHVRGRTEDDGGNLFEAHLPLTAAVTAEVRS
jgi:signal transduction histidine kinase